MFINTTIATHPEFLMHLKFRMTKFKFIALSFQSCPCPECALNFPTASQAEDLYIPPEAFLWPGPHIPPAPTPWGSYSPVFHSFLSMFPAVPQFLPLFLLLPCNSLLTDFQHLLSFSFKLLANPLCCLHNELHVYLLIRTLSSSLLTDGYHVF